MGDAHAIVLDGRSDILQKDRTPVFLRFSRPITYFNKILVNQDEENDVEERTFNLPVNSNNKATRLKICSFARPHMRAFHYSWWSFIIAYFIWFSIAPLLPEVKDTLELDKKDIWTTNIVSVVGDIFCRFLFGPITDKWGARLPMVFVLLAASIPMAMTGLVTNLTGLIFLRLFIGIAGSAFVMCQC